MSHSPLQMVYHTRRSQRKGTLIQDYPSHRIARQVVQAKDVVHIISLQESAIHYLLGASTRLLFGLKNEHQIDSSMLTLIHQMSKMQHNGGMAVMTAAMSIRQGICVGTESERMRVLQKDTLCGFPISHDAKTSHKCVDFIGMHRRELLHNEVMGESFVARDTWLSVQFSA